MTQVRPIILCGGAGKRLWPLSREGYPKQFSHLVNENETLMQASLRRISAVAKGRPLLVTGNEYRFLVGNQLHQMGCDEFDLLIEPAGRNTAPAIAAAAAFLEEDPNSIMVVSPSDHHVRDEGAFQTALKQAIQAAQGGQIVTLGIIPQRAETGYGYIEIADHPNGSVVDFLKFIEKPIQRDAQSMLDAGNFLWNSGIFVFSVGTIVEALKSQAPHIFSLAQQAVKMGQNDLDFFRLHNCFGGAEEISIDYAVMEKIDGKVVPMDCGWNDLGAWQTVWVESDHDQDGNAIKGSATAVDCQGSLIRAQNDQQHVVAIGLKNVVAIAMRDAVLVADRSQSSRIGETVELMREQNIHQADEFPQSVRPWGWFETLIKRERFSVKSIVVEPGQKLSLQSHVHRAEHWIVVEGTARVTVNDKVSLVSENESIFVPLGAVHRLENPGKVALHLIEVQTGSYLEEDDIIRYEDIYQRDHGE